MKLVASCAAMALFACAHVALASDSITLPYQPLAIESSVVTSFSTANQRRLSQKEPDGKVTFQDLASGESSIKVFVQKLRSDTGRTFDLTYLRNSSRAGPAEQQKETKSELEGNTYSISTDGSNVSVKRKKGTLSESERVNLTRSFHDGRIGMDLVGEFTSSQMFVAGQPVPFNKEMLDMFNAKDGTLSYARQYERWHRPVAEFKLQFRIDLRLQNSVHGSGTLIVDVKSGRPMLLTAQGHFGRNEFAEFQTHQIREQGVASWHSVWQYSDIPLHGLDIDVQAKTSPAGKVVGMAISRDGNALAMTSQLPDSDSPVITLYDVRSQAQVFTGAAIGEFVAFSQMPAGPYFAHMDEFGFLRGGLLRGAQVMPFGQSKLGVDLNQRALSMVLMRGYPVVARGDSKLHVLNMGWESWVGEWPVPSPVLQLATNADETRLATLDEAGAIRIYQPEIDVSACNSPSKGWCKGASLAGMKLLAESDKRYPGMKSLQLHPDKLQIAGVLQSSIVVLDVSSGTETVVSEAGSSVRFDGRGERLFTERGIWRTTGQNMLSFDIPASYRSDILAVAPDGSTLYRSAPSGDGVEMVETDQGSLVATFKPYSRPVEGAIIDGGNMYSLLSTQMVHWDFRNLNVESRQLPAPVNRLGLPGGKSRVYAHHDMRSRSIAVSNGAQTFSIPFRNIEGDPFQLSDDGTRIAVSLPDGTVEVWNIPTQKLTSRFQIDASGGAMRAMLFHPGKDYLYVVNSKNMLELYDMARKKQLANIQLKLHGSPLLTLSPNATLLAVTNVADETGVWNRAIPLVRTFDGSMLAAVTDMHSQWSKFNALRFTPDGKQLIGGDDSGNIHQWDVASGVNTVYMPAHGDAITGLHLSEDGSQFATSSRDGLVKLWKTFEIAEHFSGSQHVRNDRRMLQLDLESKAIATLAYLGDSDYVITVPDGYYTSSVGALQKMGFVQSGEVFDYEQFDLWMNRPDVILQRLGFADKEVEDLFYAAFKTRLKRLGIKDTNPDMDNLQPPVMTITPLARTVTDAETIELPLSATAGKYGLRKLRISVNSVPVFAGGGKQIEGKIHSEKVAVRLSRGLNRIQVSVLDENGLESKKVSLRVTRKAEDRKPELWLLAVGVSDYVDERLKLKMAAKDADDIAKLFQRSEQFSKAHVMTILDRQATSEKILDARQFLESARVDDQVIVFFAGHGFLDDDRTFYFGTADVNPGKPSTGLSYDRIVALVDGLSARKKVVLIDSCHSGEASESEAVVPAKAVALSGAVRAYARGASLVPSLQKKVSSYSFMLMRDKFADLRQNSGAIVLSAAGGFEYALESKEWNNGVFTYSVLDGLLDRKADANRDGVVSAKELRTYVYRSVNDLTRGRQHPTTREENLELDFPLF